MHAVEECGFGLGQPTVSWPIPGSAGGFSMIP